MSRPHLCTASHGSDYFMSSYVFLILQFCIFQATYFIPSQHHQTPAGKLYFKVVNVNNKRRKLGDKDGSRAVSRLTVFADLSNLNELSDGKRTCIVIFIFRRRLFTSDNGGIQSVLSVCLSFHP